jgi:hypothetical protein
MSAARTPRHLKLLRAYETPHCPGCGFDLHGLPAAGTCPECGTAFDPAKCAAMRRGPEVLPAIAFVFGPLFIGALVALPSFMGFVAPFNLIGEPAGEVGAFVFAGVGYFGVSVGTMFTCWRGIVLVQAVLAAQPAAREESARSRVLGCLGTGVLGVVGVLALGCTVLGVFIAGACLVGM